MLEGRARARPARAQATGTSGYGRGTRCRQPRKEPASGSGVGPPARPRVQSRLDSIADDRIAGQTTLEVGLVVENKGGER